METYPEDTYLDPLYGVTGQLNKYKGTWLPGALFLDKTKIDNILNMNIRPLDILLTSYPKSGTTWLQQIVWKIYCIKYPKLREIEKDSTKNNMEQRFPFLNDFEADFEEVENRPSPRFLKLHLPYHLLPTGVAKCSAKILYIARDVRDVGVSYYHFVKFLTFVDYKGTPEKICDAILNRKDAYGPWVDHVKSYWEKRDDENVLFMIYEDVKKNPALEIRRVAEFLDVTLTKDQLDEIVCDTSFESMKKNNTVNYSWYRDQGKAHSDRDFIRKGITGDWKNHISQKMGDEMERNLLEPLRECGLVFGQLRSLL